jgi:hypothetical protein
MLGTCQKLTVFETEPVQIDALMASRENAVEFYRTSAVENLLGASCTPIYEITPSKTDIAS